MIGWKKRTTLFYIDCSGLVTYKDTNSDDIFNWALNWYNGNFIVQFFEILCMKFSFWFLEQLFLQTWDFNTKRVININLSHNLNGQKTVSSSKSQKNSIQIISRIMTYEFLNPFKKENSIFQLHVVLKLPENNPISPFAMQISVNCTCFVSIIPRKMYKKIKLILLVWTINSVQWWKTKKKNH
jgi:hypothetical protein